MSKGAYQNLDAWKRARRFVRHVYELTNKFPFHEQYGLTAQIRRASTSVPLNIAEGNGRLTVGEWQQLLGYARGSLLELESALIIAFDLKYVTREQIQPFGERIALVIKPINGLLRASTAFQRRSFPLTVNR
jgi:four helix bundle protein